VEEWATKKIQKKLKKNVIFFLSQIVFLSKWEALIHFIWISDAKVMELFVLQAIEYLCGKKFFHFEC